MGFEFQVSEGEELTLESAVFQALGAASTCWTEVPRGVFKSEEAKEIGETLIGVIAERVASVIHEKAWEECFHDNQGGRDCVTLASEIWGASSS